MTSVANLGSVVPTVEQTNPIGLPDFPLSLDICLHDTIFINWGC